MFVLFNVEGLKLVLYDGNWFLFFFGLSKFFFFCIGVWDVRLFLLLDIDIVFWVEGIFFLILDFLFLMLEIFLGIFEILIVLFLFFDVFFFGCVDILFLMLFFVLDCLFFFIFFLILICLFILFLVLFFLLWIFLNDELYNWCEFWDFFDGIEDLDSWGDFEILEMVDFWLLVMFEWLFFDFLSLLDLEWEDFDLLIVLFIDILLVVLVLFGILEFRLDCFCIEFFWLFFDFLWLIDNDLLEFWDFCLSDFLE